MWWEPGVLPVPKMLFVLLTINGNNLCETSHDRSPGCKLIGVVFEAPLEPETELSGAV